MIAAGAVVLPETHVPKGQLWAGNPAKYVRDVTAEEVGFLEKVRSFPLRSVAFPLCSNVTMLCSLLSTTLFWAASIRMSSFPTVLYTSRASSWVTLSKHYIVYFMFSFTICGDYETVVW